MHDENLFNDISKLFNIISNHFRAGELQSLRFYICVVYHLSSRLHNREGTENALMVPSVMKIDIRAFLYTHVLLFFTPLSKNQYVFVHEKYLLL